MQKDFTVFSFRASDGNTVKLEYRQSLPSTVALAKEYAKIGYPDRYAVFAERQTELSALGTTLTDGESERGVFLSCILRPSISPSQVGIIGPLGALAFAHALEEHTMKEIGIGWISDIFCDGVKIGGATIEGKLESRTSYEYLILSFAVKLDEKNFQPRLTDMVKQVFEENCVSVPMIIAKTVLNKFFSIYTELRTPEKHISDYVGKFALTDKKITYLNNGKKKSAWVIGVNEEDLTLNIELKDGKKINVSSASSVIIPNKL